MKKYITLAVVAALAFATVGCSEGTNEASVPSGTSAIGGAMNYATQLEMPEEGEEVALITTNHGVIKLRLFPEAAPKAVENFMTLAKDGYYDGVIFHRVIEDFMIQGGDPTGTGAGGESIWGAGGFEDEPSPYLHFYRGALAMANRGANTNGSQFFIVQNAEMNEQYSDAIRSMREEYADVEVAIGEELLVFQDFYPDEVLENYTKMGGVPHLEFVFGSVYTVFGQVFEGMDTVDSIAALEKDSNDKPFEEVVIETIEIITYAAE